MMRKAEMLNSTREEQIQKKQQVRFGGLVAYWGENVRLVHETLQNVKERVFGGAVHPCFNLQ